MSEPKTTKNILHATLKSTDSPSVAQTARLIDFLKRKYDKDVELSWAKSSEDTPGFRLAVKIDSALGSNEEIYDWSLDGRLQQLRETIKAIPATSEDVIPLLRETIESWAPSQCT